MVVSPRLANDTLSDLRYAAVDALRQAGVDMVPTHRLELTQTPDPRA
ncbi:MAG: hypothetical protein BWY88_01069 [Synergistetes bacterium ADurb.Bin520]|nr:MAG: hypothetical protein BWY88_01069 [Synergistetes bacterium ADurb.Bin520]